MKLKLKGKNYTPKSMTVSDAFSPRKSVGFAMIVDKEKAKKIIEKLLKQGKKIGFVVMGLDGDWSWNSTIIWEKGVYAPYDGFDYSYWAEPIIIVTYKDGTNEAYSCWKRDDKLLELWQPSTI